VPLSSPDAIVSLASHEWERLPIAALLAYETPSSFVLLTRPPEVNEFNCHDCDNRVNRMVAYGIAAERVRVLPIEPGPGTYNEAMACRRYAEEHQMRRLVIVTSPFHTRRALATFRSVFEGSGVELGIVPATGTSDADPPRWWMTPYGRWYVAYEWAGIVYYGWKFGLIATGTGWMPWSGPAVAGLSSGRNQDVEPKALPVPDVQFLRTRVRHS
jgi:uncharacterized SAM-binding protein YcdF (DUF218 family)